MNERKEPLRSLAARVQSGVSRKLGDIWWFFTLFTGVSHILAACRANGAVLTKNSISTAI